MNILVVGGGGREHAIIKSLKKSPRVTQIYAAPGNGGMAADAICTGIGAKDLDAITAFAQDNAIDFAVVAPDDPLVLGAVDKLEAVGIPCFGPNKDAAILEGSKVFSKDLMKKYHIPTAQYQVFDDMDRALEYLKTAPIPTVVKADGLALGKGVTVAMTRQEAEDAVRACMEDKVFGESGSHIVIEEFLTGPEVSVLSFTDGKVVVPMVSSMDHKRIGDGDTGPNTGGMGTVAPNPYYTDEIARVCMDTIFLPTMRAMNAEGRTFKGCLYFGLMLTEKGPKVIEYNCRFGDPGGPPPAGERPAHHHGGHRQRHPGRDRGEVPGPARLLPGAGLGGVSQEVRDGVPHHYPGGSGRPGLRRRGQAGGRRAQNLRRPGPGGYGPGEHPEGGHRQGLPGGGPGHLPERLLP